MTAGEREKAVEEMRNYFRRSTDRSEQRISHTLEVLTNADRILEGEGITSAFETDVAALAALFHDIGIPEAERKYQSAEAKYQHMEGPPITREILSRIGTRPDILERACFIVGHHHEKAAIDGREFQAVYEADFIVNSIESISQNAERPDLVQLRLSYDGQLRTRTSIGILEEFMQANFAD